MSNSFSANYNSILFALPPENQFQSQGLVDDQQLSELGRKLGADYICGITVNLDAATYYISCRVIDVKTAEMKDMGRSSTYVLQNIDMAAQEAVLKFSENPEMLKRAMAKRKKEEAELARMEEAKRREREEQSEKRQRKAEKRQRKAENRWKYSYFSWGVGNGITYGKLVGLGMAGRHGGLVGVGYEAGFGSGMHEKTYLHYSAGVRVYPFKALYASASYGIIGVEEVEVANTPDGRWSMPGSKVISGVSFLTGLDIRFRMGTLTLAGGVSYKTNGLNIDTGNLIPAWNIAYSMAVGGKE
ncbi:MAG: CCDC34 family protein [Prevotellaceae bacterium]|nr:CCDC34 family protein [Prevotellaceae bacterium]